LNVYWGVFGIAASLLVMGCSSEVETNETAETEVAEVTEVQQVAVTDETKEKNTAFIPAEFDAPTLVETEAFKIVPLGPELVEIDYAAYMSSIEHLQKTFTRSKNWPREGITDEEAMLDMETEQARFENRESFAYAVLTPDGSRERGCIYVYPSPVEGYDAMVRMWVTKAEYDAGFDAELYSWAQNWVEESWPFAEVAYPGRAIEWAAWDTAVAEQKAKDLATSEANLKVAEGFIDAFYSFDANQLKAFLTETDDSAERILYYQGWAEGGNYIVVNRGACEAKEPNLIQCPITVQDDPVVALKTNFNVTDTFHLTFVDNKIASIDTSSNDQPIYYEARKWVEKHMPEVMSGPCQNRGKSSGTPQDCARAMTEGYKRFYAATRESDSAD
jgi:hypothetical protein